METARPLTRWVRGVATVLLLLTGALLVAVGGLLVVDEVLMWAPLATASDRLPGGIALMAAGLAAIALLPAVIPWTVSDVGRRTLLVVFGGPAVLLLLAALVVQTTLPGCGGWEPDGARWRADVSESGSDAAVAIAAGLARCGTLDGASRVEVRRLLGAPHQGLSGDARNRWRWNAGMVNDTFGLGDGEYLTIRFHRGRAFETDVAYGD